MGKDGSDERCLEKGSSPSHSNRDKRPSRFMSLRQITIDQKDMRFERTVPALGVAGSSGDEDLGSETPDHAHSHEPSAQGKKALEMRPSHSFFYREATTTMTMYASELVMITC
jgi:hypothetical protein